MAYQDHDDDLTSQIAKLVAEEHQLRRDAGNHSLPLEEERARIAAIEVELDRLWDLRRQRSARRAAHQDPNNSTKRSANIVEGYQQ